MLSSIARRHMDHSLDFRIFLVKSLLSYRIQRFSYTLIGGLRFLLRSRQAWMARTDNDAERVFTEEHFDWLDECLGGASPCLSLFVLNCSVSAIRLEGFFGSRERRNADR
jgi:hypothetical protein